jgi:hypothetical protein
MKLLDLLNWLQGLSGPEKATISVLWVLFCIGLCAVVLFLLWEEPKPTTGAGTTINQNVTSHNQSGGTTAHKVNVDAGR